MCRWGVGLGNASHTVSGHSASEMGRSESSCGWGWGLLLDRGLLCSWVEAGRSWERQRCRSVCEAECCAKWHWIRFVQAMQSCSLSGLWSEALLRGGFHRCWGHDKIWGVCGICASRAAVLVSLVARPRVEVISWLSAVVADSLV